MEDIAVEHRHRCLIGNRHLITEMPSYTIVTYQKHVPFLLRVVTLPDGDVRYIDRHGWMFDDNTVTKLLVQRKVKVSTESDVSSP
jgi:hypothetical protein